MNADTAVLLPLDSLELGELATIVDISGDQTTVNRLEEMGIRCGSHVVVKNQCGPLLLNVDGRDILLRCGQAVMILVSVASTLPVV